MRAVIALLLLSLPLAGCLGEYAADATQPTRPKGPGGDPIIAYDGPWPDLGDARIRPGVQVFTPMPEGGSGQCTANFMFRSADNASLYLGVAAHCFGIPPAEPAAVGTVVNIADVPSAGTVAFNGWEHNLADTHDFGLVRIQDSERVRGSTHPAVRYFGGPTALANSDAAVTGTQVITYGASGQRGPNDPDNPREGYVYMNQGGLISVVTDHPGIQGDSGSGLMTASGQALGVLSTGIVNPTGGQVPNRDMPTSNNYVPLDRMLRWVQEVGGPEFEGLEVVPWELLQGPELPGVPAGALPATPAPS